MLTINKNYHHFRIAFIIFSGGEGLNNTVFIPTSKHFSTSSALEKAVYPISLQPQSIYLSSFVVDHPSFKGISQSIIIA